MLYDNLPPNQSPSSGTGNIGTPDDGTYSDGFFNNWNPAYKCSNAFDDLNELLLKLLPPKPDDLSTTPLVFESIYTARQESTSDVHNCTDDTTPKATAENFFNGDDGILTCEIDSVSHGVITITPDDDTGKHDDYLTIIDDSDPYAGQSGKEGIWKQLSAEILPTSPLSYDKHEFALTHSQSGSSINSIWVDNPQTATITSAQVILPNNCNRWISGVPSLEVGDSLGFHADLNNAVGKHYHNNYVARVYSVDTDIVYFDPLTPPSEGDVINVATTLTIQNNRYNENVSVVCVPYNSKGQSPSSEIESHSRVDTISQENRVRSGNTQYPSFGISDNEYGDTYDSTISLKDSSYYHELQLLNGQYQFPHGNYSSNLPTAGPDYSSGMGNDDRWVAFKTIHIDNKSGLNLVFSNTSGTWNGVETSGIQIYIQVLGVTGWLDCNHAYPGVGSPSNNGDYAMVYSMSSATSKRITFGSTVRTGDVYLRIALPSNSNKRFGSINVTAV